MYLHMIPTHTVKVFLNSLYYNTDDSQAHLFQEQK